MQSAAAQAARMPDCPVARIAADYLFRHIEEERDHAGWLLTDLAALGIDQAEAQGTAPMPAVRALLRSQSQAAASTHPVCVFGYLLVLEGSPPLPEQLDAIQARTGLPRTAFHCLRAHGEDDPAHLAELNNTIDRMPLTLGQQAGIALSAFAAIDGAAALLDALHVPVTSIRSPSMQPAQQRPEAARHA